ncbi:MAG: phenylalanine--tRNA ligase subunit beta, partial [Patescibacteria group bacterium]
IKQSPDWMQKRLSAVGMRPINNIVDITNYVMLELGQPTHTFDLKKISNFQTNSKLKTNIIIRTAKNGEIIKTLDGQERKLNDGMLVIADDKKPIALAGVMGGADTEIDNKTNSILIEAANFDSVSIRKTAQKLGLRSEASMRFEKSLDPNLCEMAMTRIIELVKEFCPQAKIISELQDEKKYFLNQGPIELDLDWVNKKIGVEIGEKKIIEILGSLGFKIEQNKNVLSVIIPTWRATKDISIPEDLIEEIIRIYGYDNLDSQMPKITMQAPERNEEHLLERKIKNILSVGAKLTEVYNYSFVGEEQLEKMKINFSSHIKLINPIASHQTMLRQSLIPNLLENIKLNQAKYESINLFEIGNIFFACDGNINKDNVAKDMLPNQEKYLGIIMADKENNLFNKIKGIIKFLTNSLNLSVDFELTKNRFEWMDKNVFAQINILDKNIGIIAQLDDQIAKNLGIKKQVVIAEINIQKLYDLVLDNQDKKYKEIAKYPSVVRDLAFVVENEILYSDIKKDIENFNDLIKQVELFDIYQGEKLGQNKKNLAFHIIYQADRTLTSEEVDKVQEELIKYLKKKLRAKIRDF